MFNLKKIKEHWPLVILLVAAAVMRLYRLPEMASFDFDQEYAANFAWSVLKEYPIQLIGQGLSVQGLFMGPLYFYFLTPFFAFFNLHPVGGAVGSVFIGLITIVAYYYYANKLFGKPAGLIAAFFRTIFISKIGGDWLMIPSGCELAILATWYYFYQYWLKNTRYLPVLGFIFGLYTSFHPILFPFYLVFLVLVAIKRVIPNFKTILLSIMTFIIPVFPLILFEYFHNFLEVKRLFSLFVGRGEGPARSIAKVIDYFFVIVNGAQFDLGLKIKPGFLLFGVVFLLMIIFTIKKIHIWKNSFHLVMTSLTIGVFILYYYFLPVHVPEYYFLAPVTLITFYLAGILGFVIRKPKIKFLMIVFLFFIAFINIRQLQYKWSDSSVITLAHKDKIVKEIISRKPINGKYFVSYISLPGWNFGFNYLFKYYRSQPFDRVVDGATFTIVIPKSLSEESIDLYSANIGLILPNEVIK
jgi:hypothetical protein